MPRSVLLENYGDVASVLGLLFTIVTMFKAQGAKKAAEEARQAAREAVARIASQLIANETELSLQFLKQTEAALHERQWVTARFRCVEARNWLARLPTNQSLHDEERSDVDKACDDLGMIIGELEKMCSGVESKKSPPRVGKRLHDSIKVLTRIKSRLENRHLEV